MLIDSVWIVELAGVLPLPEADQGPSPSALVARTWTS